MNTKEKILSVIHGLADDVSIDEAIERLHLLQKIEAGLKDADEGRVMDHDEFMRELEEEDRNYLSISRTKG
ncbi:MAG: hypothetical protein WD648_11415 [Planctomycetaceae bacterium]